MVNHLGQYVRHRREELGIGLGELAERIGYKNISKGCRRIMDLEQQGACTEELWKKVHEALLLDDGEVREAVARDGADYQAWLDEPVPMDLVIRYMPCVYVSVKLPAEAVNDPQKAEEFACQVAREKRHKVCLVVSRRLSVWIDEQGAVYARTEAKDGQPNAPYSVVGGKAFRLNFGQ